jgi:hypothetical protein
MTSRQILDRAVLRACNRDIRLRADWEAIPEKSGYEPELAEQILRLLTNPVGSEDDAEMPDSSRRYQLESALKRCPTIDAALAEIGRL